MSQEEDSQTLVAVAAVKVRLSVSPCIQHDVKNNKVDVSGGSRCQKRRRRKLMNDKPAVGCMHIVAPNLTRIGLDVCVLIHLLHACQPSYRTLQDSQQHHAQMFPTPSLELRDKCTATTLKTSEGSKSTQHARAHAWGSTGRLHGCSSQLEKLQIPSHMVTDILHAPSKPYSRSEAWVTASKALDECIRANSRQSNALQECTADTRRPNRTSGYIDACQTVTQGRNEC